MLYLQHYHELFQTYITHVYKNISLRAFRFLRPVGLVSPRAHCG